jgi:hypothetical protein
MDGQWTVVYREKDGKKSDLGKDNMVTIRDHTVSWTEDGKEHKIKVQFGPMQTFTSTPVEGAKGTTERTPAEERGTDRRPVGDRGTGAEARSDEGSHHGVYILSHEFLCISSNDMTAQQGAGRRTDTGTRPAAGETPTRPQAGRGAGATGLVDQPQIPSFVLILKKASSSDNRRGE